MITRPLDLAARLRPGPSGLDALFYVNVGALALFFFVFGSRYVLAPGLAVDFSLPKAGAVATAYLITDVVIAVPASNMAVVDGAVVDFNGLEAWLRAEAASEAVGFAGVAAGGGASTGEGVPRKRLLVQASGALPARDIARLYAMAADAGFAGVLLATNDVESGGKR